MCFSFFILIQNLWCSIYNLLVISCKYAIFSSRCTYFRFFTVKASFVMFFQLYFFLLLGNFYLLFLFCFYFNLDCFLRIWLHKIIVRNIWSVMLSLSLSIDLGMGNVQGKGRTNHLSLCFWGIRWISMKKSTFMLNCTI